MKTQHKTKLVATIGPSTNTYESLLELVQAGVDVCRLNFSHGDRDTQINLVNLIRRINADFDYNLAILGDLQGPKIRVRAVQDGGIELEDGTELLISTDKGIGTRDKVFIQYKSFAEDVRPGEIVLVDDGKIVLEVKETNLKDEVKLKIINGGLLTSKKGVNLPNTKISMPCLTEKDLEDLEFALEHEFEWLGLSFVRSATDVMELKQLISKAGKSTKVIAKIEKPEAMEEINHIIRESDGIMVARGDLGVEVPMQEVPLMQKDIVKRCKKSSKPVIIATQMMESMITNYNPTRAEVNDVANAILDGADAVMLSAETSVGKYPVRVVQAVQKIIERMEESPQIYHLDNIHISRDRFITDAVCRAAVEMAEKARANGIITMTFTGYTAYEISSYRPKAPIFVFTGNRSLLNQLSLVWGVKGFYFDTFVSTDHSIEESTHMLKKDGHVKEGDLLVHTASVPIQEKGQTNMLKLHHVK